MAKVIDVPGYGPTEFPDDMDDAAIVAAIQKNMIKPGVAADIQAAERAQSQQQMTHEQPGQPDFSYVRNIPMGALAGAMDIGKTLMYPVDAAGITGMTPQQRRASLEGFYQEYANPESLSFKGGRLGTQVAGTAGVGQLFARGAQAFNAAPKVVNALRSGGFNLGTPQAATMGGRMVDAGARIGAGGVVGGASAGLIDPESYQTGALLGSVLPHGVQFAGRAGSAIRNGMRNTSEALMYSALKPTIAAHRSGDAKVAVETLLKHGIPPTEKGAMKLHSILDDNSNQVASIIGGSDARINRDAVLGYLGDTRGTFMDQVDPMGDLATIQQVADNFSAHPYFNPADVEGQQLREALARATLGKTQALQAAGKLKTMGAQQGNLAHGQYIQLSPNQPVMQPYFNVGLTGRQAVSPSAYPVQGMPRIPGRYTHNMDRVPESVAGVDDAMAAYQQRRLDESEAKRALEWWEANKKGTIPIQKAQAIKQGTQHMLAKKYGQQGTAEVEASKGIARGLREEIAKAEPAVAPLNAEDQKIIQTLNVMERRLLMDMNKNPAGLSLLAGNKLGLMAFLADRSAGFKTLAARMIDKTQRVAGSAANRLPSAENALLRTIPLSISASQAIQQ